MTKMIVAIAVCLGGCALAASSAQGAPFTTPLNVAYSVALDYWGNPPAACASVRTETQPPSLMSTPDGDATGLASPVTPDAPPHSVECMLVVDQELGDLEEFGVACTLVIHEMGHLFGLPHSADPTDPMYPEFVQVLPACKPELRWARLVMKLRRDYQRRWEHVAPRPLLERLRRETRLAWQAFTAPLRAQ
jgi:hypothetical protein